MKSVCLLLFTTHLCLPPETPVHSLHQRKLFQTSTWNLRIRLICQEKLMTTKRINRKSGFSGKD